jgi:hypothetical protein
MRWVDGGALEVIGIFSAFCSRKFLHKFLDYLAPQEKILEAQNFSLDLFRGEFYARKFFELFAVMNSQIKTKAKLEI